MAPEAITQQLTLVPGPFPPASHLIRRRDADGQPLLANGMTWKAHMYLMIVSAKLLADTENRRQVGGWGVGGVPLHTLR